MRRRYDTAEYATLVSNLRRVRPDIAITTDVIAGFPGETGVEFEETVAFLRAQRIAGIHPFRYSVRSGTPAEHYADQVPDSVKQERMTVLVGLGRELEAAERCRHFQQSRLVLLETATTLDDEPAWTGYIEHYIRTIVPAGQSLRGLTRRVTITGEHGMALRASLAGEAA
jgi:threonylcarbamoyladenosine tRNA methylthiotransferase MtaB